MDCIYKRVNSIETRGENQMKKAVIRFKRKVVFTENQLVFLLVSGQTFLVFGFVWFFSRWKPVFCFFSLKRFNRFINRGWRKMSNKQDKNFCQFDYEMQVWLVTDADGKRRVQDCGSSSLTGRFSFDQIPHRSLQFIRHRHIRPDHHRQRREISFLGAVLSDAHRDQDGAILFCEVRG